MNQKNLSLNLSPDTCPTRLSAKPDDKFPIQWIPIQQVDYRWGVDSPERRKGGITLIAVYKSIIAALALGAPPPEVPPNYKSRYPSVKEIYDDLGTIGLRNPLIVYQVEPGRYLTLTGNQRRCALEAAGAEYIPCRIASVWRGEHEVLRTHPPEMIIPIERLDYRWGKGGLNEGHGTRLIESYPAVIRHLKAGTIPEERTIFRYFEMVRAVCQSIEEHGLSNYLLVWPVDDQRFLVLVGNQRLVAGRVWNWPRMPCRVTQTWDHNLMKVFPYEKVDMPWPM